MTEDNFETPIPPHNEQENNPPEQPEAQPTTSSQPENTPFKPAARITPGEKRPDNFEEIRGELISEEAGKPPKKPGFFARLFGGGKTVQPPVEALAVKEEPAIPPEEAAPEEIFPAANVIWSGPEQGEEGKFEVYRGYEENQPFQFYEPEDDHLTEKGTPEKTDEEQEPGNVTGDGSTQPPGSEMSTSLSGEGETAGEQSEEQSPEWRSFLNRFWKNKDEDEAARTYTVSDDDIEDRLTNTMPLTEPEEDWERPKRDDGGAYRTIPGELPRVDQNWLAGLRQDDVPPEPPEAVIPAPPAFDGDWTDQVPVENQPAETPETPAPAALEDDWMSALRSQETQEPAPAETSDWIAGLRDEDSQVPDNRLESAALTGFEELEAWQEPAAADASGADTRADQSGMTPTAEDDSHPYSSPETVVPAPGTSLPFFEGEESFSGRTGENATPILPEYMSDQEKMDAADAEAASRQQVAEEERAAIFARGPEDEESRQQTGVLRSTILEGYEAQQGPVEVYQPSTGKSGIERFASWMSKRSIIEQILLVGLFLAFLAAVIGGPIYFFGRMAGQRVAVVPTTTPVVLKGIPYPTGLKMTGGWYFILQRGLLVDGAWQPQAAEWLDGTELRRVIGLPWNRQSEAVFQSLKAGDEMELQLSNGDKAIYKVSSVQQVPVSDVSIFTGRTPSLALILFQQDANSRWVVIGDLK